MWVAVSSLEVVKFYTCFKGTGFSKIHYLTPSTNRLVLIIDSV